MNGRYLEVPTSDASMGSVATLCDVSQLLTSNGSAGTATKGAVTTLGGIRVLPLNSSDGSVAYVTDTSKPEPVEATAPKGSKAGSGKVTFSVDAPVTLTAPPASQVIDGSKLGM